LEAIGKPFTVLSFRSVERKAKGREGVIL